MSKPPRRASSVQSNGSHKSQMPAPTAKSAIVLSLAEMRRDLKLRAAALPQEEFVLPATFYTRDVVAESAHVRLVGHDIFSTWIGGKARVQERYGRMAEAKYALLRAVLEAEQRDPGKPNQLPDAVWREVLAGRKDFLKAVGHARNREEAAQQKRKKVDPAPRSSTPLQKPQPLISVVKQPVADRPSTSSSANASRSETPEVVKKTPRPVLAATPLAATPLAAAAPPQPMAFSIISIKPADSSLLPRAKDASEIKQKKSALESLVTKLTKKEEDGSIGAWKISPSPSSSSSAPSPSPPTGETPKESADSSNELDPERAKKNKRKSSEPTKIISETALETKPKGKGGKRKRKGGRKPPPIKKRKMEEEEEEGEKRKEWEEMEEEEGELSLFDDDLPKGGEATTIEEDEGLPPRIVVAGQEPGTELEWDEEEIIVLRVGEQPEQRPPRLRRKKRNPEAVERDEATPAKGETTAMDDAVREQEEVPAPASLNSSQSSEVSAACTIPDSWLDDQSDLTDSRNSTQSLLTDGPSPTTSPSASQVLSTITDVIAEMVPRTKSETSVVEKTPSVAKRVSLDSNSSGDSSFSGGGGRSRRAIRIRARYSPTPEDGASTSRPTVAFSSPLGAMEANGVQMSKQISPL